MRLGQILVVIGEQLLGDEKPVRNENDLKHPDGFALEPQMSVAPRPELRTGNVTLRDIDSSRKAYSAVDDQNLAVVAVVDMAREPGKNDRHEAAHLDARPAQPPEILAPEPPAPYVVVDQPHLDALGGLGDQDVGDLAAQLVVLDDVVFHMDRLAGLPQRPAYLVERLRPVVQHPDAVVHGQQRLVAVEQQRNGIAVIADLGLVQQRRMIDLVYLLPAQRIDLLQIVQLLAVEQFLLAVIAAEHDVEDESHDRQQRDHDDPRQRLDRLALVVDDHGDRNDHEQNIADAQK